MKSRKIKGISRMDYGNTHGWFVRVYRDGKVHSKLFSDGVHGGKEAALKAARKYRNDYEKTHPRSLWQGRFRVKPPRNNKTGIVGVSETYHRWRNGTVMPCFSVSWCPRVRVPRTKKIYLHHYGSREEALLAAAAYRKERELEMLADVKAKTPRPKTRPQRAKSEVDSSAGTKRKGRSRSGKSSRAVK